MYLIWSSTTIILLIKIFFAIICSIVNVGFVSTAFSTLKKATEENNESEIYILVPLLREQTILKTLFIRFTEISQKFSKLKLVFITTEREIIDNNNEICGTTIDLLTQLIEEFNGNKNQILHLHYPKYNSVVAEQLNYAVAELNNMFPKDVSEIYTAIYNADSVVNDITLIYLFQCAKEDENIYQQSSLFLWNLPRLLQRNQFVLAGFGLYQSGWTIQHELTRLRFSKKFLPEFPECLTKISLVHCVSHGLLIKLNLLQKLNGFPIFKIGGEDLALGFILKVNGFHPIPIPILENSETPENKSILIKQLAGWYLGTLGYLFFWKQIPAKTRSKNRFSIIFITILGILDSLKWLLKGFIILAYLIIGLKTGNFALSFFLYLFYIYIPIVAVLWLWKKLPNKTFPKPDLVTAIICISLYWIIPILRSIPAFLGLWWGIKIYTGSTFLKPKTERL